MDPYPRKDRRQNWSRKHDSFIQKTKENHAEKDSWDAPSTTHDQHPNVIQSMKQGELLGVDHLNPVGPQGTSNPGIKTGDEEGE
jgi:hypothetical protein